ncbi:MAG: hypothetical protein A2539_02785 [Elusimicrobia bacterium RIFOXYD2_FULL_34_15]|nr:MAG: hypothetical protein A2539_02785 [Elusimicrobia bacterium RIFOXYD2_FULL_34_15]
MNNSNFDEKLAGLKKTITMNKAMWEKVFSAHEDKWKTKIEEKQDEISRIKEKAKERDGELTDKLHDHERTIFSQETEIKNIKRDLIALQTELLNEKTKRKEEQKSYENTIMDLQKEMTRKETLERDKYNDRDVIWQATETKNKDLEEEHKIMKNRLVEEQKRWEEVLRMKEENFTVLKKELETRVKEWQAQYQEYELEVQKLRKTKTNYENQIKELQERFKSQEQKMRGTISTESSEIEDLRRQMQHNEKIYNDSLLDKEKEIEMMKKDMDIFLKELTDAGGEKKSDSESSKKSSNNNNTESMPDLEDVLKITEVGEEKVDEGLEENTEKPKTSFWKRILNK